MAERGTEEATWPDRFIRRLNLAVEHVIQSFLDRRFSLPKNAPLSSDRSFIPAYPILTGVIKEFVSWR
jgi:hypothetical protein